MTRPDQARRGLTLALCLLLPVTAAAEPAPKPVPVIGSESEYRGRVMSVDCARWTVHEPTPEGRLVETCGDFRMELDLAHDLNPVRMLDGAGKTLVEFKPFAPNLRFPLEVGASWSGDYVGYTGFNQLVWDGQTRCKVAAREKLTLASGEYDTFRIECREGWKVGPKEGGSPATRWYAPAVGRVVKETHGRDPDRWNFELLHVGLPAPPPPPAQPAPEVATPAVSPPPAMRPRPPPGPDILDPNEY